MEKGKTYNDTKQEAKQARIHVETELKTSDCAAQDYDTQKQKFENNPQPGGQWNMGLHKHVISGQVPLTSMLKLPN
jgi:hypothetical protein